MAEGSEPTKPDVVEEVLRQAESSAATANPVARAVGGQSELRAAGNPVSVSPMRSRPC